MTQVSRRSLLASGLAAGPLLSLPLTPVAAQAPGNTADQAALAPAAIAPREELLLDFGWRFAFGHAGDPSKDFGFGMGQGDFAKTGDSRSPNQASTIPAGARWICRTIGRSNCLS